MSLEQAVIDNTAAVRDLIATMTGAKFSLPAPSPAQVAAVLKPAPAPVPAAPALAAAPPAAAPVPAAEAAGDFTVEHAKALVVKLANTKGRDTAVALLGTYGVNKASDLPEDKIAVFCERATAALAA